MGNQDRVGSPMYIFFGYCYTNSRTRDPGFMDTSLVETMNDRNLLFINYSIVN